MTTPKTPALKTEVQNKTAKEALAEKWSFPIGLTNDGQLLPKVKEPNAKP